METSVILTRGASALYTIAGECTGEVTYNFSFSRERINAGTPSWGCKKPNKIGHFFHATYCSPRRRERGQHIT